MALVFHYHQGKFGLNIFLDLKSKQIKYKKLNLPTFYNFDQNKVCLHFLNINFSKNIPPIWAKQIECYHN